MPVCRDAPRSSVARDARKGGHGAILSLISTWLPNRTARQLAQLQDPCRFPPAGAVIVTRHAIECDRDSPDCLPAGRCQPQCSRNRLHAGSPRVGPCCLGIPMGAGFPSQRRRLHLMLHFAQGSQPAHCGIEAYYAFKGSGWNRRKAFSHLRRAVVSPWHGSSTYPRAGQSYLVPGTCPRPAGAPSPLRFALSLTHVQYRPHALYSSRVPRNLK